MKAAEIQPEEREQLLSPKRFIPDSYLLKRCNIKAGEDTCRYVFMVIDDDGIPRRSCAKKTSMREKINIMVDANVIRAKGDNCEGLGDIVSIISSESTKSYGKKERDSNNQEKDNEEKDKEAQT